MLDCFLITEARYLAKNDVIYSEANLLVQLKGNWIWGKWRGPYLAAVHPDISHSKLSPFTQLGAAVPSHSPFFPKKTQSSKSTRHLGCQVALPSLPLPSGCLPFISQKVEKVKKSVKLNCLPLVVCHFLGRIASAVRWGLLLFSPLCPCICNCSVLLHRRNLNIEGKLSRV